MKETIEIQVEKIAQKMVYPATPELHLHERKQGHSIQLKRLGVTLALVGLICAGLLTIKPVRAALSDVLELGGIRILVTNEPVDTNLPTLADQLHLAGQTTFTQAQTVVPFHLYQPSLLGAPDEVYLQESEQHATLFLSVWRNKDDPMLVDVALFQVRGQGLMKGVPSLEMAQVNGNFAIWIERPHALWIDDETGLYPKQMFIVSAPVLIWEEGMNTMRLETRLPQARAIEIAESLQ